MFETQTLARVLFGVYVVVTTGLALWGMRKTRDLSGFALGNKDMGPLLVGTTLAAAIASTATFVINPGFVYTHGLSALLHFGVAATAGIIVGLVILSKGFRRLGNRTSALTLPHWIGERYRSDGLRTWFALLNLVLAITFIVLIIKGSALVMQHTLGLSYSVSVLVVVGFVFSYILMGGTYAHAYTNAFQGALMIVVAIAIVASGLHLFGDGIGAFADRLAAHDPNLVAAVNPTSPLFGSTWDVFVCGFVVAIGLVCQPHILTKSLYLKRERDLSRYLVVASVIGIIFAAILLAGLYARIVLPSVPSQDAVMATYITEAFSPAVGVLISVALLAAGMSTMDGILVSASTIAANDLLLGAVGRRLLPRLSLERRQAMALPFSRVLLVVLGAVSFALAIDPPQLVGIFAQVGIYGLIAGSLAPVAFGIFVAGAQARHAWLAAILGPLTHFAYYGWVVWGRGEFLNPAVSATAGVLVSVAAMGVALGLPRVIGAFRMRRVALS